MRPNWPNLACLAQKTCTRDGFNSLVEPAFAAMHGPHSLVQFGDLVR